MVHYPEAGHSDCLTLEENSFWFAHRNSMIAALVSRFRPGGTLFDIGGGNGVVAQELLSRGIDAAVVEPGEAGARNARRRGVPKVIHATLEGAGFAPGSLPAAGLFDVLEHIEDDAGFLRLLHGLLQPGAPVFLSVPAYRSLWSSEDVYARHFRRYTLRSLRRVLSEAGFAVQYDTCFFRFLVLPILLTRTIPSWLRLRRSFSPGVARKEHAAPSGPARRLLDRLCRNELAVLRRGGRMGFGASCLVAARKS